VSFSFLIGLKLSFNWSLFGVKASGQIISHSKVHFSMGTSMLSTILQFVPSWGNSTKYTYERLGEKLGPSVPSFHKKSVPASSI
jgi:hypothetical protein